MNSKVLLLSLVSAFILSCVNAPVKVHPDSGSYTSSRKKRTESMLNRVRELNSTAPKSFALSFTIQGLMNRKRYKTIGKMKFNKTPRMMEIVFLDFIFRSPLTRMFQKGDIINIYYPVEKKIFVDNVKSFNLQNYSGIDLDFSIIYNLMTGSIPLIKNCHVREGLIPKSGKGFLLLLESGSYYETISFKGDTPDRILVINKATKKRFEFFLGDMMIAGGTHFYKNIKISVSGSGLSLRIKFSGVRLNTQVHVKTIKDINIPANVKVFQM